MKKNYTRLFLLLFSLLVPYFLAAQLKILNEGFESGIPADWTKEALIGTNQWIAEQGQGLTFPDGAKEGQGRVYYYASSTLKGNTARLITAKIPMDLLRIPSTLKFSYALPPFTSTGMNDTLRIYCRLSETSEWLLMKELNKPSTSWQDESLILDNQSKDFQIAFEAVCGGGHGVALDAIVVTDNKVCQTATGLTASQVTSSQAKLSWSKNNFAKYYLKVSTSQITDFSQPALIDASLIYTDTVIKNLTPETTYYFYIKTDCSNGDEGDWTSASFTTGCIPVETINDGFESYKDGKNLPIGCWKAVKLGINGLGSSGDAPYVIKNGTTIYAATGQQAIRTYAFHTITGGVNQYSENYLIAPELSNSVDISKKQLSFNMKCDKAGGKVYVGIAKHPDPANYASDHLEVIHVFENTATNTYERKVLPLNNYLGEGRYIVIYTSGFDTRASTYYDFDDIELQPLEADCNNIKITSFNVNNDTSTVSVGWNAINTTKWNLKVSSQPINPNTDYADIYDGETTSNPHVIKGLNGGMAYYYYVQPICEGNVVGKWSDEEFFTTDCNPVGISIPYKEYFDTYKSLQTSGINTPFPVCWKRYSTYGISTSSPTSRPYIINTNYSSPGSLQIPYRNTDWSMVVLPAINDSIKELQMTFMASGTHTETSKAVIIVGMVEEFKVPEFNVAAQKSQVSIDTIATIRLRNSSWEEYTVKFNNYTGTKKHIVFITPDTINAGTGTMSLVNFNIDNLEIDRIRECNQPEAFEGSLLADNESVSLSWENTEGITWEVMYGVNINPVNPANTIVPVATNTITINGLESNSKYDFYVRAICGTDNISYWTGPISFTTPQTPHAVPYLTGFEDDADNRSWTFLNGTYPNQWMVGTATKSTGNKAMYVTTSANDNNYANVTNYIFTYRVIDVLEDGLYDIKFDWKAQGEGTTDYMRVFLVPNNLDITESNSNGISNTATPKDWVSIGAIFNLQKEWNDTVFTHIISQGKYRLVFYWTNNATVASNYPPAAAIDNVEFVVNESCMRPVDVNIKKINDTSAELQFVGFNTPTWRWIVAESEIDPDNILTPESVVINEDITSSIWPIENLRPDAIHYYYLKTPCDDTWISGTFKTKCAKAVLKLTESFDNYGTGINSFASCWTKLTNNTGNYPYIDGSRYYSFPGSMVLYQSTSTYCALVSPMLDVASLSTVQIQFQGMMTNASHKLVVGVITDPNDRSTFTPIETVSASNINEWEYFEVPFDKYTGNAKYIALFTENLAQSFYIDNVVIEPIPSCRTPRELKATDITSNSAKVSWNGYNKLSFNLKVSRKPINPEIEDGNILNEVVNGTTKDLSGLTYMADYYWYVQAICDEETSDWSKEARFTTDRPQKFDLPFTDNFDTYGTGTSVKPAYWTVVKANGNYPYVYSTYYNSSPGSLYFSGGSTSTYQIIAVPELNIENVKDLTVSFKARFSSTSNRLLIGVISDLTNPASFVEVARVGLNGTNASVFEDFSVNLSSYTGTGKYIAFSSFLNTSSNTVYLDDVIITETNPKCSPPDFLFISDIKHNSAKFTWGEGASAPDYFNVKLSTYPIRPMHEDGDGEEIYNLDIRECRFENLKPLTTYYVYIQGKCEDTNSGSIWVEEQFTTICSPHSMPFVEDFSSYMTIGADVSPDCWIPILDFEGNPSSSNRKYPSVKNVGTTEKPDTALSLNPTYYSSGSNAGHTMVSAITPLMDMDDISKHQMTFKYKFTSGSRNYRLYVGILSDWSDVKTWHFVDTIYSGGSTDWQNYHINFSDYPDNAKQIIFRAACDNKEMSSSYEVYIDDIVIEEIPDCAIPYGIYTQDISENSATISWKAGNNKHSEWKYYLTTSELNISSATFLADLEAAKVKDGIVTTTSSVITGLSANTGYYFYVASTCGENVFYPKAYKFTTLCEIESIPYFEDFNSYTTGSGPYNPFPPCWYRQSNSSYSTLYPYCTTVSGFADMGRALYFYSQDSTYNLAVMPEFDVDIRTLRARFNAIRTSSTSKYDYKLYVGIMSNPSDTSTFVIMDTIRLQEEKVIYEKRVSFSKYTGTGKYIAFLSKGLSSMNIDDLHIEEDIDCDIPLLLKMQNRNDTTFTVNWSKSGNTEWEIIYGLKGFDKNGNDYVKKEIVNDSVYIAKDGVLPNTDYDIYVRTVCTDVTSSAWTNVLSITTLQTAVDIPYYVNFEDVNENNQWTFLNGNSNNKWVFGDSTATTEGGHSLYLSANGGGTYEFAPYAINDHPFVYRRINLPEGKYDFSFKWKSSGDALNYFLIGMLIPDTFVLIPNNSNNITYSFSRPKEWIDLTGNLSAKTDWTESRDTLIVSKEIAGTYNLVFYWKSGSNMGNLPPAIDDLAVVKTACTTPERFRVIDATKNTATFEWLSYNTESWKIKIFDRAMAPADIKNQTGNIKDTVVTDMPVTIAGLPIGTKLYAYIQSDCDSVWVMKPFMTVCPPANQFPIVENFDTYGGTGTDYYMECWTKLNTYEYSQYNNGQDRPYISDSRKNSGIGSLYITSSTSAYSMAVSPEFNIQSITKLHMSFVARESSSSGGKEIQIGVITNPKDIQTFTPLKTVTAGTGWDHFEISLDGFSYVGDAKYIAILSPQGSSNSFYIDDLRIGCWEEHDMYDKSCMGYPYSRNGFNITAQELSTAGTHTFTRKGLRSVPGTGCDSIITLHLSIDGPKETIFEASICEGEVYNDPINGFTNLTEEKEYIFPYKSVYGCDSTVTLKLKVNKKYLIESSQVTCSSALPFTWRGMKLSDTDIYYDSLLTVLGCDSIYKLDFKVMREEIVHDNASICAGGEFIFNGKKLTDPGIYKDTLANTTGCDSIVILDLKVHPLYNDTVPVTICEGSTFNDYGFVGLSEPGIYTSPVRNSVITGCDSLFTIILSIANKIYNPIIDSICPGEVYTKHRLNTSSPGLHELPALPSVHGCDSIVTVFLKLNPTYEHTHELTILSSEIPYQYHHMIFNESGTYKVPLHTVLGCDSIINLTLTVLPVGLETVSLLQTFSLIPNPVDRGKDVYVNYDFTPEERNGLTVEIFNSAGIRMATLHPEQYPINVGEYMKNIGMHFVRITTGTNKTMSGVVIVR